jgi:hypothetical protein
MKQLALAAVAAAALAGCATSPYDNAYSIITTDYKPSSDWHVKPVFVNRVDGENSVYRNMHVVAPGPHQVTIDLAPIAGFHLPSQATFPLETRPCTRYYVAARLVTEITQEWTPMVRYTEPITECQAKFRIAATQ